MCPTNVANNYRQVGLAMIFLNVCLNMCTLNSVAFAAFLALFAKTRANSIFYIYLNLCCNVHCIRGMKISECFILKVIGPINIFLFSTRSNAFKDTSSSCDDAHAINAVPVLRWLLPIGYWSSGLQLVVASRWQVTATEGMFHNNSVPTRNSCFKLPIEAKKDL